MINSFTMEHFPLPTRKYRHYKGGLYKVLTLANHTDTKEALVVYKSISFGGVYARPLKEWSETVTNDDGQQVKRFEEIRGTLFE
jgi:hypothetical protein